ncbi:MAG: hypothetical protein LBJ96_05915 [Holosporaceae bacterium]|jgi:hypothetical protein|nr:hypothetical protein [Holosporaceae bacterium]
MIFHKTKHKEGKFKCTPVAYEKIKPIFSFKDFHKDTEYYNKEDSNSDRNSLLNFLNAAKDFCNLTWEEIKKNKQFHAHTVDKTIPGFNLPEDLVLFQFKLPNHDKGRFVGYFDNNCVFHILIYDRNHQIYSSK